MGKYIKYIILILLAIVCIFLIWNTFIKKNPELDRLENKIIKQNDNQIDTTDISIPSDLQAPSDNPNALEPSDIQVDVKPIIDDNTVKPNDNNSVIISSETEMLNEQGEELLKELSKQLEQSFSTIESTTGVVDEEILDNSKDINMGE